MTHVRIDWEVYDLLSSRLGAEDSLNDLLRAMLGMMPKDKKIISPKVKYRKKREMCTSA